MEKADLVILFWLKHLKHKSANICLFNVYDKLVIEKESSFFQS